MSNVIRFSMVSLVAGASAIVAAQAVLVVAGRPLPLRSVAVEPPLAMTATLNHAEPHGGTILKASDGHYWANGQVDGEPIRFLVDTGATAVALTPADAQRLGVDLSRLHYGFQVVTAGGQTRAAAIKLRSVSVAGATLQDVDALVIEKGLDASLLGMSYLGRLSSFQATRETLVLQP